MKATDQDLLLDLARVHKQLGYISYTAYASYGKHSAATVAKRFYSFKRACAMVNITPSNADRAIPTEKTRTFCVMCEVTYSRPKDDPSHRKCDKCRGKVGAYSKTRAINEDFLYAC